MRPIVMSQIGDYIGCVVMGSCKQTVMAAVHTPCQGTDGKMGYGCLHFPMDPEAHPETTDYNHFGIKGRQHATTPGYSASPAMAPEPGTPHQLDAGQGGQPVVEQLEPRASVTSPERRRVEFRHLSETRAGPGVGQADMPGGQRGSSSAQAGGLRNRVVGGIVLLITLTATLFPVGASIAHTINQQLLRYAFSVFLLAITTYMYVITPQRQ